MLCFFSFKNGDECFLCIGDNNEIREFCSIHRSSKSNDKTVCNWPLTNIIEVPRGFLMFWVLILTPIGYWWQQSNHGFLSYRPWLQDWWPQHICQQYASCGPCDCRSKIFLMSILWTWISQNGFTWFMLWLQDYTHTAGATVIHQFCHIGSFAFIGGGSVVHFLILLKCPHVEWVLTGAVIYRFHKMFQSTCWWLEKEPNFAVWIWRDLDEMDLPCQSFVLCSNLKSFEVKDRLSLWSFTKKLSCFFGISRWRA